MVIDFVMLTRVQIYVKCVKKIEIEVITCLEIER